MVSSTGELLLVADIEAAKRAVVEEEKAVDEAEKEYAESLALLEEVRSRLAKLRTARQHQQAQHEKAREALQQETARLERRLEKASGAVRRELVAKQVAKWRPVLEAEKEARQSQCALAAGAAGAKARALAHRRVAEAGVRIMEELRHAKRERKDAEAECARLESCVYELEARLVMVESNDPNRIGRVQAEDARADRDFDVLVCTVLSLFEVLDTPVIERLQLLWEVETALPYHPDALHRYRAETARICRQSSSSAEFKLRATESV